MASAERDGQVASSAMTDIPLDTIPSRITNGNIGIQQEVEMFDDPSSNSVDPPPAFESRPGLGYSTPDVDSIDPRANREPVNPFESDSSTGALPLDNSSKEPLPVLPDFHRKQSRAHRVADSLKRKETQLRRNISKKIPYLDKYLGLKDDLISNMDRKLYINQTLPDEELDPETGMPIQQYPRNKIRTTKYTPLNFVPKNLWYQFHNIANIYFLFIVILSAFPIFGVVNPGLSAVPIIAIVVITAIKDAVEDYRRTILDSELNNTRTVILDGFTNHNVVADNISTWRRIKKACTRGVKATYHAMTLCSKKGRKKRATRKRAEADPQYAMRIGQKRNTMELNDEVDLESLFSVEEYVYDRPPRQSFQGRVKHPSADKLDSRKPNWRDDGCVIDSSLSVNDTARFREDYWKNIKCGDIVKIFGDEEVPADVVILSTSDPDGACFVETRNLDGETNLKVRQALRATSMIRHAKDLERSKFCLGVEKPHAGLYSFSGVLEWHEKRSSHNSTPESAGASKKDLAATTHIDSVVASGSGSGSGSGTSAAGNVEFTNSASSSESSFTRLRNEPVSIGNVLLRGSSLRNTKWVIGVVAYTGVETKIMLNSGVTPTKRSRMMRQLNFNVICNLVFVIVLAFIAGVIEGVYYGKSNTSATYFEFGSIGGSAPVDGLVTFWAAVILLQNLIPISLYISIEIVRLIQAFLIYSDIRMYYEPIDYPCTPKSWNISDDVGQVEYIFSDKTGTLTQNIMEFRKCTINGVSYGKAFTEAMFGMLKRGGQAEYAERIAFNATAEVNNERQEMIRALQEKYDNKYLFDDEVQIASVPLAHDIFGASGAVQQEAIREFFCALALCNDVLPEKVGEAKEKLRFKSQSPDEAALVTTAKDVGVILIDRNRDQIVLDIEGEPRTWDILGVLEFTSARKRMSLILKDIQTGQVVLYCKGADSVIYKRLGGENQSIMSQTTAHLEEFANEGLRTLCIAKKVMSWEQFTEWNIRYQEASSALQDRESKIEAMADEIEQGLTLLGGTAIEDRLQDGVSDTITLLGEAGCKLWVLTGDKVGTAINIGYSCNLLTNDMELLVMQLRNATVREVDDMLTSMLFDKFGLEYSNELLKEAANDHNPCPPDFAFVIDGETLAVLLSDPLTCLKFVLLSKHCSSVMCCRVSPAQKATVVKLVRNTLDITALSVGDGANDVAMIQEADVGVGIAGLEGRQAVMSSDYAIGQFRFLQRLILVHGRWSYNRVAELAANLFYKNVVFTLTLFWYDVHNSFDGSYLFDYTYITLFNLAFTSLPVIFMGFLDQDVSDKVSLAVPQLYRKGILRQQWNNVKFWIYMADGVYQSAVCYFFSYCVFYNGGFVTTDGRQINYREAYGVFTATAAIIACNLYVLINEYRWDWLFLLIVAISILLVFFWTGIYTVFVASAGFYKAAPEVYASLPFWANMFLQLVTCLLPRFACKAYQKIFMPYDVDVIRERVQTRQLDPSVFNDSLVDLKNQDSSADDRGLISSSNSSTNSRASTPEPTTPSSIQTPPPPPAAVLTDKYEKPSM